MEAAKIMIVEDDLIIARSTRLILEREGYAVGAIAVSFQEAIDAAEKEKPDIVIMDINLNGIDGIHTAKALRKTGEMQIIYCTEMSDRHSFEMAKETFPAHYITKPFTNDELLRAVALAAQRKGIPQPADQTEAVPDSLLVEVKGAYKRILLEDILYMQANGSYTRIVTASVGEIVVSLPSNRVTAKIACSFILRSHRSWYINIRKVDSLYTHKAIVAGREVPIAPQYKEAIFGRFHLLIKEKK